MTGRMYPVLPSVTPSNIVATSTSESINDITSLMRSIKKLPPDVTKKQALELLSNNIDVFTKLKQVYSKLFLDNSAQLTKYSEKLKSSTKDYSKHYFNKKIKKYKDTCIEILIRLQYMDNSINNQISIRDKIVEDVKENVTKIIEKVDDQ